MQYGQTTGGAVGGWNAYAPAQFHGHAQAPSYHHAPAQMAAQPSAPASTTADVPWWVMPVGRSWVAIAAGYAGLLSPLLIFAPVAVILSIAAMVHLKRNPEKGGWGRAIFGLVMGVIFTFIFVSAIMA